MDRNLAPQRAPLDIVALLLGQWWGSGRSPVAPGTIGSLATVPFFLALTQGPLWLYWLVTLAVTLTGFWASQRCSELLGEKDPKSVVIDEAAGVLIAMGMVQSSEVPILALAWLLFRLLDIKKPWLIDRVQHLKPHGVGIMADDLLAGVVSGALCSLLSNFLPPA